MREAYRLHKQQHLYNVLQQADKRVIVSVGYVGKEVEPYLFIEKKMLKLLAQLGSELTATAAVPATAS
jgi:ribonuclease P protein component